MAVVLSDPSLYRYAGGEPPTEADVVQPLGYFQSTTPTGGGATEIAWVIGCPWQGRRRAKQAARLLVAALADRGAHDVIAHIHPDHVASQRVALHLGMSASDDVVER